jgi:hypothetical protein
VDDPARATFGSDRRASSMGSIYTDRAPLTTGDLWISRRSVGCPGVRHQRRHGGELRRYRVGLEGQKRPIGHQKPLARESKRRRGSPFTW